MSDWEEGLFSPAPPAQPGFGQRLAGAFDNPMFQMGLALMGGSRERNPLLTALQAYNQFAAGSARNRMAQAQLDQQKAEGEANRLVRQGTLDVQRKQVDLAEKEHAAKYSPEALAREARKAELEGDWYKARILEAHANAGAKQGQRAMQDQFLTFLQPYLGGGLMAPPAPGAAPALPAGPTGPAGKYGTPTTILDGIERVESGGNPNAINPTSGAMGAYQFMPGTVDMLKKQGLEFDPMNRDQARDAADFYFQQLLKQHGGDTNKALAAYGGFKAKDPSGYIGKVMGVPPGGPAPAGQAPAGMPQQNMTMRALGALGYVSEGDLGKGLSTMADALEPRNVPAGTYQVGPDGKSVFLADPYKDAEGRRQDAELDLARRKYEWETGGGAGSRVPGVSPKDASQMTASSLVKQVDDITKSYDAVKSVPESLSALERAREALPGATPLLGSAAEKKMAGLKFLNNNLGWLGVQIAPEAVKNAEVLRSALFTQVLDNLKKLDAQPSAQQQAALEKALGQVGTDPSALPTVMDIIEDRLRHRASEHNRIFSEAKQAGAPFTADLLVPLPEKRDRTPGPAQASAVPAPAVTVQPLDRALDHRSRQGVIRPAGGGVKFLGFE